MPEANPVLVSAIARGVLGEYDHSFDLGENEGFRILYGPNGVGKTKFLEIIDALSNLKGFALSMLPFESATLTYSDGTKLSATRSVMKDDEPADAERMYTLPAVSFSLCRPRHREIAWKHSDDDFISFLRRSSRYEQISDVLWQDPTDGEIAHVEELRIRYEGRPGRRTPKIGAVPETATKFISTVPSFLIETQRLQVEQPRHRNSSRNYRANGEQRLPSTRITEQAKTLRDLLNEAQTHHSRITQQLDRSFPNRVLQAASDDQNLNEANIRELYTSQNEFRSRLGRVASVSLENELSLPKGSLDGWKLALLNQYLEDAKKKLAPFEELLAKIELLEQIINDRLLNKSLSVTDVDGLKVEHNTDHRDIMLDSLSSGEQHEIIVMIDLLFNVRQGAVVLIDEPEISLHIAWQMAFIPDVEKIAELAGFRFVVATHSPQIINDQWDRAVRLGPEMATF